MNEKTAPKAIDLFCGCGGIAAGLRRAGFSVLAGVDVEPKYMATFEHNFPKARALNLDLTKYNPFEIMSALRIEPGELELLAGGPPCQGFSKNVPRSKRQLDDENNLLIRTFLDHCEVLEPKVILMENVAEMRNGFAQQFTLEICSRLTDAGYSVTDFVLNAAEYGVPQKRRRAFFLGTKETTQLKIPEATHSDYSYMQQLFDTPLYVTVWEAIGDLPSLNHGEGNEQCEYVCDPFSDYQARVRSLTGRVRNHVARRLRPVQYARIASLQPGQGYKDLPDEIRPRSGYSGAYGRLTKEMVAPTITRWLFHPGSGRWGHPKDLRTLTIREAARIQGFEDDFEFLGSFVQQAGQIGNAVPPILIEQIGLNLRSQLRL